MFGAHVFGTKHGKYLCFAIVISAFPTLLDTPVKISK